MFFWMSSIHWVRNSWQYSLLLPGWLQCSASGRTAPAGSVQAAMDSGGLARTLRKKGGPHAVTAHKAQEKTGPPRGSPYQHRYGQPIWVADCANRSLACLHWEASWVLSVTAAHCALAASICCLKLATAGLPLPSLSMQALTLAT